MITRIKERIHNYWVKWINKRIHRENPQIVNSKNIYILPSKFGWIYGLLVLSLLTGAINYQISMIFLMTFLLAIIGLVSAWEACANMNQLSFKLITVDDAQQYKPAQLTVLVKSPQTQRFSLSCYIDTQSKVTLEQLAHQETQLLLPVATSTRGCFSLPRIVISSQYPLGIFTVWSYVHFKAHYYVYPQAVDPGFWPPPQHHEGQKNKLIAGNEELHDLKQTDNPWSAPNRIAWKIAAKGQGWYHKVLASPKEDYWLFRLDSLPGKDVEKNLQYLSYWLQAAEANGYIYALDLGKETSHFAQGQAHLKHLLRQLALY